MFEDRNAHASSTDLSAAFGADSTLVDTLHRIASWAAEAIESTAFASITLTCDRAAPSVVYGCAGARDRALSVRMS